MNLLLLLSALLSAVTGVAAHGGRVLAPQVLCQGAAETCAIPIAVPARTSRPETPLATLVAVARPAAEPGLAPAVREPLYAGRRRE
ncbi:MAG: hypothetical protein B7Y45_08135 [Sphingomonas sp. 28-66-16]|nr:MAG: hypothetical protein B7Y45_08135 [Sphingomonas sp. 28-66-16]